MTGAGIVYLIYITSTSWILAAVAVAALLAFGVVTTLCVLWSLDPATSGLELYAMP